MKIPWTKIARVLAEVVIDAITGKLERRADPPRPPLPHVDSERQSKFAREAGRHGVVKTPPR